MEKVSQAEAYFALACEVLIIHLPTPTIAKTLHGDEWEQWYDSEVSARQILILGDPTKSNLIIELAQQALKNPQPNEVSPSQKPYSITLRQERILTLRYGLEDCCIRTLSEVSDKTGLNIPHVEQVELEALKRLRNSPTGSVYFKKIEALVTVY